MLNIDAVYILSNILLLVVFIISGYKISKNGDFNVYAFICIVIYSLILGLRYERGYDYMHYVDIYTNGYDEGEQKIFELINFILTQLGIGKYYIYIVYSFIEMLCAFIFIKKYKYLGLYIIPLFMIATIAFNEYLIRQAIGFSFVWLCVANILDLYESWQNTRRKDIIIKKVTNVIFYFLLSYSIHSADGYLCIIMFIICLLSKKPIPLYVSIPLLIIATYFFSRVFDFTWLNVFFKLFVGDERMAHYIDSYDKWFTFDSDIHDNIVYTRNEIVLLFEMIGSISLLYFARKTIKHLYNKRDAITFYNFFVLGVILLNAFREVELLQRVARCLYVFWFFPLSLVLYYRKQVVKTSFESYFYLFLIWWCYDYLKYLFFRGEMTKFLWDA